MARADRWRDGIALASRLASQPLAINVNAQGLSSREEAPRKRRFRAYRQTVIEIFSQVKLFPTYKIKIKFVENL